MKPQPFHRAALAQPLLLIGLFIVSLLARILASDLPINIDEVKWLFRGLSFLGELVDGDLAGTYIQHHPGVTTMWLNGVGLMLHCALRDWLPTRLHLDDTSLQACAQLLKAQPFAPVESYVLTRLIQAIATSTLMVGLFVLIRQLLGGPIALISLGVLTLEPFFLAYQRLLTTDALQTDLMAIAVLALLLYWRGDGRRPWLITSGVFMGLATATKTPALTLLPGIIAALVLIESGRWRNVFPQRGLFRQCLDLALWGGLLLATIVVIWPAMWVAPLQTLGQLVAGLQEETERGTFFFLGQITDAPSGWFYPLVLVYRLSPVLWIGLLTGLWMLLLPQRRRRLAEHPLVLVLLVLALSVFGILSLSGSKIDRYILPMIPLLAIVAAVGWQALGQRVGLWLRQSSLSPLRDRPWKSPWIGNGAAIALAIGGMQLATIAPYAPYYLTYYNPLAGGPRAAQQVLMMGNGEGLDRAADWLNQQPGADTLTVASWYLPSFAPYFQGTTLDVNSVLDADLNQAWLRQAHRLVVYINQIQRQLPDAGLLDYFADQGAIHTVRINGVDYAHIYPGPMARPEDLGQARSPDRPVETETLHLRGYTLASASVSPGDALGVTLYWEARQPVPPDTPMAFRVQRDGQPLMTVPITLLNGLLSGDPIEPGAIIRDFHWLLLPTGLLPGRYTLALTMPAPAADALGAGPTEIGGFEVIPDPA